MSAFVITAKDLVLLARDRRTAAMLLALPLIFISIIGLTTGKFPGLGGASPAFRVAVADAVDYAAIGAEGFADPPGQEREPNVLPADPLPPGDAAAQRTLAKNTVAGVVAELNDTGGFRADTPAHWATILGGDLDDPLPADRTAAARDLVDRGLADAAVIFGPQFYRRVYTFNGEDLLDTVEGPLATEGLAAFDVEVYSRGAGGAAGAIAAAAKGAVRGRVSQLLSCRDGRAAVRFRRVCDRLEEETRNPPREIPLSLPPTGGGAVSDVYDELVPGYTVMFVFFLVNLMARSFLYERDLGTLRRLRTTPARPSAILVGKTLPFYVVSVAQTVLLFLAGKLLFGMNWGPRPWLLVPVILTCSAAATGLGLLVATLVKSEAQVSAYATSVVIVLAGISGCFMPRNWLPDLMQTVSLATPHAWALIAYDQILAVPRPDAGRVAECSGMLLLFAAAFLAIGAWRFAGDDV